MGEWTALDRSDWPEIVSPDFGGKTLDGTPLMQAVCPGCGLYREHDEGPSDHFEPCPWVAARLVHNAASDPESGVK